MRSAEYFFDNDLGVGIATTLAIESISGQLMKPYAGSLLSLGLTVRFHCFYIRKKNSFDNWRLYYRKTIYVKNFDIFVVA